MQWFDSRQALVATTLLGREPVGKCQKGSKKTKNYLTIDRPDAVTKYNSFMGGVDNLDRCICIYSCKARSIKWMIRLILHMVDSACAAGWLRHRRDMQYDGRSRKEILDYLDYRTAVAEGLNYPEDPVQNSDGESVESGSPETLRKCLPMPPLKKRKCGAQHMPEMGATQPSRSRCSALTTVRCVAGKVYLCFNGNRNCFKQFHY